MYYKIRTLVRIIFWGALALLPYGALPTVSTHKILAGEIFTAGVLIWLRTRKPHTRTDTPVWDSMVRDYGDPLK